jgi:hypothetical protein
MGCNINLPRKFVLTCVYSKTSSEFMGRKRRDIN